MVVNRFCKVQVRLVGRVILESNFNTTKKYEMPNGLSVGNVDTRTALAISMGRVTRISSFAPECL